MNLNALAAILAGLYILAVAWQGKGNLDSLLMQLREEKAFVPWFAGIIVLYVVYKKVDKGIGGALIAMAFIAMMITSGSKVLDEVKNFFKGG